MRRSVGILTTVFIVGGAVVGSMEAGDDYYVRFSREAHDRNCVGADAVKVEQVSSREAESEGPSESDDLANSKGQKVVQKAKRGTGVPYRLGEASRSGIAALAW